MQTVKIEIRAAIPTLQSLIAEMTSDEAKELELTE